VSFPAYFWRTYMEQRDIHSWFVHF
jgi:hypothetical protein